eukprot:scaffold1342_cov115-Skeletonema_dohrnii-CCMP3373.AAC.3
MAGEEPTSFSAQSQGDNSLETANNNVVPSGPSRPPATKTKRITAAAKEALIKYFEDRNWPRNKKMPKANGDPLLDRIINDFGLKREQASRQLAKWKKVKYEKAQVEILIDSIDVIKEAIEESMSETPADFVANFLDVMIDASSIDGCNDTTNLIHSLRLQPHLDIKLQALRHIRSNRDHNCFKSLVLFLNDLIQAMAEELPALASKLSVSEISFSAQKESAKSLRIKQWRTVYNDMPGGGKKLSEAKFARFGMFVAECLYFVWIHSTIDNDLPPVEIPAENLVAKYSLPVIYYVAGWTLQRTSLALTVAKAEREKYFRFAFLHKCNFDYAKENDLPYSIVKLREKKNLFYVSKKYFDFICLIESVYVKNLSMKMMMAYCSGDLVKVIHGAIMRSDTVRQRFFALFKDTRPAGNQREEQNELEEEGDPDENEDRNTDRLEILGFILARYIRMRGCWFVKALKSNKGETLGEKKLAAAPTNMKVAQKHSQSKAVAEALREATRGTQTPNEEQVLWNQAAEEVIEYNDEEDANEITADEFEGGEIDDYDGSMLA